MNGSTIGKRSTWRTIMKTIKIKSSFWVGDIVYGIVAKYNDGNTRFWCHSRKDWIVKMIEEWEKEITLQ